MYSERKLILGAVAGLLVAQIVVMITTLALSLPRVMATSNCISATIPVEMVAYRYVSCDIALLILHPPPCQHHLDTLRSLPICISISQASLCIKTGAWKAFFAQGLNSRQHVDFLGYLW